MANGSNRLSDFPDGMYPEEHPYSVKNDPEGKNLLRGMTTRLPVLKDRLFNLLSVVNPTLDDLKLINGTESDRVNCILKLLKGLLQKFLAGSGDGSMRALAEGNLRISDFELLATVKDAEELRSKNEFLYDAFVLMIDDTFAVPKGVISARDRFAQICEINDSTDSTEPTE